MSHETVKDLATEAGEAFISARREDGSSYVKLREGAPVWMQDMAREAHGEMLPDDWRYDAIVSALECIGEADDAEDAAHEWADGMVDVYTGERLAWLASHGARVGYCDEAAEEGMLGEDGGILERIAAGQYVEAREVFSRVLVFLEQRADEVSA